jgi:hypothetical protein
VARDIPQGNHLHTRFQFSHPLSGCHYGSLIFGDTLSENNCHERSWDGVQRDSDGTFVPRSVWSMIRAYLKESESALDKYKEMMGMWL